MSAQKIALVSVSDKSNLVYLCRYLTQRGWKVISTGGTYELLKENEVLVTSIAEVTKFPEILGGRVKTLHPIIHGGILSRSLENDQKDLFDHSINPIDLVVCNLYPFVQKVQNPSTTLAEAVEEIDIGGVALIRASAKNFERVTVIVDPSDYHQTIAALDSNNQIVPEKLRSYYALKAFRHTSTYDCAISNYLASKFENEVFPDSLNLSFKLQERLRYGENSHQLGAVYKFNDDCKYPFKLLQGIQMSYNNILDMNASWDVVREFEEPAVSIVKHCTPCGIATADNIVEAYTKAYESDTISAFGSIISVNRPVTLRLVEAIGSLFVEVLVSRSFDQDALNWLAKKKKNCRIIQVLETTADNNGLLIRSIDGGILLQTPDNITADQSKWKVVSKKKPDEEMWRNFLFAWKVVKHIKSNAIVFTQGTATVGIGCGQPNRLDSVRLAANHAKERANGAICSSDAFFPFPDGIEAAASHGVSAIIQPGGSIRDESVIEAVDKLGLIMVFTGERHFKH